MVFRVGIIGLGGMGARHVRVVSEDNDSKISFVSDSNRELGLGIAGKYNLTFVDPSEISYFGLDGLIIATDTESHFEYVKSSLEQGVACLVEKPICSNVVSLRKLLEISSKYRIIFKAGMVEKFNPAVQACKDLVREPIYISLVRHSPKVSHSKDHVELDLAIHDVNLALSLVPKRSNVEIVNHMNLMDKSGISQHSEITFKANGTLIHISSSRLENKKRRELNIIDEIGISYEIDLMRQTISSHKALEEKLSNDGFARYAKVSVEEIIPIRSFSEPLMAQYQEFKRLAGMEYMNARNEIQDEVEAHMMLIKLIEEMNRVVDDN